VCEGHSTQQQLEQQQQQRYCLQRQQLQLRSLLF
jgi:hypothetical protein